MGGLPWCPCKTSKKGVPTKKNTHANLGFGGKPLIQPRNYDEDRIRGLSRARDLDWVAHLKAKISSRLAIYQTGGRLDDLFFQQLLAH